MEVKDALMLMIGSGSLIVALLALVVAIIAIVNHQK